MGPTSTAFKKAQGFAVYAKRKIPDNGGNCQLVSPFEEKKHIFEYSQGMGEGILAVGDKRPKCKQITTVIVTGVLVSCTRYLHRLVAL